jgi:threonine/homoserine/homoserine lactone efflux protein
MLGTQNLPVFILSGMLLNITPGQDTFYIVGRSIAQGRKAGILSVFGICTGALCHNLIASFGLAALLRTFPLLFNLVKYAGAAYLAYLGVRAILSVSGLIPDLNIKEQKKSNFTIYREGILTNLLNPKVALFFLAFLPQFIDPVNNYGVLSLLFLGFIFILSGTIWCMALAFFSSKAFEFLRHDHHVSRLLNKACGILFIALALNIILFVH